jgi:tetratricopeptide (TPR) repeat protein
MKTLTQLGLAIVLILTLVGAIGPREVLPRWANSVHAAPFPQDVDCYVLNQEGVALYYQARYPEALSAFQDALACYRDVGDRVGESTTLNNIGLVYHSLGQHEEALDYYQQALAILRESGDRAGEGTTLNNIGYAHYSLGQYEEALEHCEQALAIQREAGDRDGEAATLNNIGLAYNGLGRYEEALECYKGTLTIVQETGNQGGEGVTLNNIGGVYERLGRYEEALDYYRQALAIRREIGDRAGEGSTLNNIGLACYGLGRYEEALSYYQQALAIWQEISNRAGEGTTLNNIGLAYNGLGQYEEALSYYERARAIQQEIGDQVGEGTTLHNIGSFYRNLRRYEEALNYYEQALAIAQEICDRNGEAATLNNIGLAYDGLGQYEEALTYFEQALVIQRDIGARTGEGATLSNIGSIYHSLGRYEEALDYYEQALTILQEIGNRAREGTTLGNIGRVYDDLERPEEALGYYEQAISLAEAMRGEMRVEEFKSSFTAEQAYLYNGIIDLLDRMERPAKAFDYVQRSKARTLLDQLSNVRVDPLSTEDARLVEEEETLRGEIQALDARLREEWAKPPEQRSEEAIGALTAQLAEKRDAYEELLLRLKLENPEYASLVTVNTLSLTDIQALLTDTTLVEYYVLPERTLAFVVTGDGFHIVPISVTRETLVENVQTLYAFPSLEGVPPTLQTLYQDLFAPVTPYIHTDLVGIAPHGELHYVPFAALHDGERYLAEKHTLFYIPSASVLPFALDKRKPTVAPPLVLGDPDGSLPNARQEAQAIAELYGVTAHVGEEAQEHLLWEQGPDTGILHLSTHGFYDARSPLFSYVLLTSGAGEDGRLDVYEIYNRGLDLQNADLVVLSACQTSRGELSRGDEIVSLNRALIYAGTPSVMTSLWSVDDVSTRELMERFYTHLQEGMSKAGALRAAQMELVAEGTYAHPYYWAAFGVTGDPGEGEHVLPEMMATATPEATPTPEGGCGDTCPAAALPLALVVLAGVRRRKRERSNS